MDIENIRPEDIEHKSMEIIESELGDTSRFTPEELAVAKRVIHATADFDYLKNLKFSVGAADIGIAALKKKAVIVTDTNMALAGINKAAVKSLGCELYCFMADDDVKKRAKESGTTRAVASVEKAAEMFGGMNFIYLVGNAPTALIRISELVCEKKMMPALVVGVPVGFVNVVASKEMIKKSGIPYIVADGRKGGSTVAAAICNAMLYRIYNRQ